MHFVYKNPDIIIKTYVCQFPKFLLELREYIDGNIEYLDQYLRENLATVTAVVKGRFQLRVISKYIRMIIPRTIKTFTDCIRCYNTRLIWIKCG